MSYTLLTDITSIATLERSLLVRYTIFFLRKNRKLRGEYFLSNNVPTREVHYLEGDTVSGEDTFFLRVSLASMWDFPPLNLHQLHRGVCPLVHPPVSLASGDCPTQEPIGKGRLIRSWYTNIVMCNTGNIRLGKRAGCRMYGNSPSGWHHS